MPRTARSALLTLGLLLITAGCSTSPSTQPQAPPPSPAAPAPAAPSLVELHLDGTPGCQLLTAPQLVALGSPRPLPLGSAGCSWSAGIGQQPQNSWNVSTTAPGLGPGFLAGNPPLRIDGYPAGEPSRPTLDVKTGCELYVDIAHDQTLRVSFATSPDYPGITHRVACQQAARVVDLVLTNARAKAGVSTAPTFAGGGAATLPPRPAPLPLAGQDPCALLDGAQPGAPRLPAGQPSADPDGPTCGWRADDGGQWTGQLVTTKGAADALGNQDVTVVTVGGYGAVQSTSRPFRADQECTLDVDVADGQDLRVEYNNPPTGTGRTHQDACNQAGRLAAALLTTLRDTPH